MLTRASATAAPMHVRVTGNELTWEAEADLESGLAGKQQTYRVIAVNTVGRKSKP